jgi:hypothetical protein
MFSSLPMVAISRDLRKPAPHLRLTDILSPTHRAWAAKYRAHLPWRDAPMSRSTKDNEIRSAG